MRTDFSFDRESSNGFIAAQLRRTDERCPMCGATLYVANDLFAKDRSYERRKYVCANCFSVKMALTTSPIQVAPVAPELRNDMGTLHANLEISNRTRTYVRVWAAAAPRHGPITSAVGPIALIFRMDSFVICWLSP